MKRILVVLLLLFGWAGTVVWAQPFNAQIVAALRAIGLWPYAIYTTGDFPVWSVTSNKFVPSSGAGSIIVLPASTCAAPAIAESGALTTGLAFTATPEIWQCLAATKVLSTSGSSTTSKLSWWSDVGHGVTDIAPTNVPGYIGGDTSMSIVGLNGPASLTSPPIRTLSVSNDKTSTTPGFLVRSTAKNNAGIQPLDNGVPLFAVAGYPDFAFVQLFEVRGYSSAGNKTSAGVYSTIPYVSTFAGLAFSATGAGGSYGLQRAFVTNTAPSGPVACTSPTVTWHNGTAAFQIDVGTTCAGISTLVVTLPTMTNAPICWAINTTTSATAEVEMTASTTTTATFTNFTRTTGLVLAWVDGADIRIGCTQG